MKIKKNDIIKMISGKDKGKTGKVTKIDKKNLRLIVENINVFKKRVKPKQSGQKGETVLVPRPFRSSKAMIVCPNCKQATRVGRRLEGNSKIRYCKKCQSGI